MIAEEKLGKLIDIARIELLPFTNNNQQTKYERRHYISFHMLNERTYRVFGGKYTVIAFLFE